eukprot:244374-Prymnesium_polylepis.1
MPHAPSIRLRCNPRCEESGSRVVAPRASEAMPLRLAENGVRWPPPCTYRRSSRCDSTWVQVLLFAPLDLEPKAMEVDTQVAHFIRLSTAALCMQPEVRARTRASG